jgi:hypothetical protein
MMVHHGSSEVCGIDFVYIHCLHLCLICSPTNGRSRIGSNIHYGYKGLVGCCYCKTIGQSIQLGI